MVVKHLENDGREDPGKRLERIMREAMANEQGKPPKDVFMGKMGQVKFDMDLAHQFGVRDQAHFMDGASDWWDKAVKAQAGRPHEKVEIMGFDAVPEAERKLLCDFRDVSPNTPFPMQVARFNDPNGERTSNASYVLNMEHYMPGGILAPADFRRIREATLAESFIPGVTSIMPDEDRIIFPWQGVLEKRSALILPEGQESFSKYQYAFVGKGLRFVKKDKREFKLAQAISLTQGGPPPRLGRMVVTEDGRYGTSDVLSHPHGGITFNDAKQEYVMMMLAWQRGITNYVGVDDPVMLGRFEDIDGPQGRQGYLVTRMHEQAFRGNNTMTNMNNYAIGQLLADDRGLRERFITRSIRSLNASKEDVMGESFRKHLTDNQFDPMLADEYGEYIEKRKAQLAGLTDKSTAIELAQAMMIMNEANTLGANVSFVRELLAPAKKENEDTFKGWADYINKVHMVSGMSNRIPLEHGLSHKQTYPGNIRYNMGQDGGMSFTVCDWQDGKDLLPMSYPKAFAHATNALVNCIHSAVGLKDHMMMSLSGADPVASVLDGFRLKSHNIPGMDTKIPDEMAQAVYREATTCDRRLHDAGGRSNLEKLLVAGHRVPVVRLNHPLVDMLKRIYPPEKHNVLKERFEYKGELD
ncbi:hypothetical protein ACFLRF_02530 [Candidatus Altiarchaeota archaeon]